MAWDGTGERLAVAFGGVVDSVYDGLVALFDTRQTPIVSMSQLVYQCMSSPQLTSDSKVSPLLCDYSKLAKHKVLQLWQR
jgi:hypothetical protein